MRFLVVLLCFWATTSTAATPWETYLDEPTPANASRVEAITYSTPIQGGYDANDLEIIHLQVVAADEASFRLAYRLLRKSDGALAEERGAILAASIRPHPAFFLRQVVALKQSCSTFNADVAGLEYVDRPKASAYELHMRRLALASVHDKPLISARDQCLALLGSTK